MESRIPLPTDNIYKFYALFGLLLIIFASGTLLYVNQSTNNLVYDFTVEYHKLSNIPEQVRSLEEQARIQVIESKLNISKRNKDFFITCISVIVALGSLMVGYGFRTWHKVIQPMQDELTRLNIKKLKQEVGEE